MLLGKHSKQATLKKHCALFRMLRSQAPDKILQEGPRDSLSGTTPCLSTYHYGVHGEISQAFPHTVSDQKLDVNLYITYPFGT